MAAAVISVVMPAHNEQGYLEPAVKTVVTGLRQRGAPYEVIVVENGSSDATGTEADHMAHTYSEVVVLREPVADYGAALRAGFLQATGDVVVNFDVDMVDLDFLDRALARLEDSTVVAVIGSKRADGATDERSVGRQLVTAVFSLILRRGFGLRASDTHGLKALRRQPMAPLVEACRFGKDIFDTELILRAERAGLTLAEIPVVVADQRPPRTSILSRVPRTLVGLARLRRALGPAPRARSAP
jgi:glycosyltransferase involved in cell wall biosynthesis